MSLWPSEREQTRKGNYKQSVDAEESRRRRHEGQMVDIRKAKREESLQKKRHVGFAASAPGPVPAAGHSVLQQKVCVTRAGPDLMDSDLIFSFFFSNLRLAGVSGSPSAAAAVLLIRPALTRPISTGFREERDTFGPIQVPNDKLWGVQMQRSLQNFDISGERERMPVPIIHAFGVLKKCAAKGQHDEIEAKFFEERAVVEAKYQKLLSPVRPFDFRC